MRALLLLAKESQSIMDLGSLGVHGAHTSLGKDHMQTLPTVPISSLGILRGPGCSGNIKISPPEQTRIPLGSSQNRALSLRDQ